MSGRSASEYILGRDGLCHKEAIAILDELDAMASRLQVLVIDAAMCLKAASADLDFLDADEPDVLRYRDKALELLNKLDDESGGGL